VGGRAGVAARARRDRGAILTRLLLDTTFLIDADRSGSSLDEVIADDDDVAIAAITIAELRVGALLGTRKRTGPEAKARPGSPAGAALDDRSAGQVNRIGTAEGV